MGDADRLQILRPLGADQATLVARDTSGPDPRLVVVERVTRASPVPAARAELLRRGRALVALEHPKVVRVHDVFEREGEVLVVSDYVDGEWLAALMMMRPRPPVEIMIRLVLDVLEGLSALHALRDDKENPLHFVHGAIAPDTVLVADDGVAEIARTCRLPRPGSNERYVAPELRRGEEPADVRADVYAAGAILRDVLVDAPADASWAEPLADIAWRACSVEPENRWPSAAAMATTVRRIAGAKVAPAARVAELVRKHFGNRIRARRSALETGEEGAPTSADPISLSGSEIQVLDPGSVPTAVRTLPPPPVQRDVPVARVTLVKKPALVLGADEPAAAESEPETERRLPEAAPVPVAPPPAEVAASRPPSAITAPPPAVVVAAPFAAEPPVTRSLPPPTIVPDEAQAEEAYRRRMPTFPTLEEAPPRARGARYAVLAGLGMLVTFALGWWLGRAYAPASDSTSATCPPATATAAAVAMTQATTPPSHPSAAAATEPSATPVPSASVAAAGASAAGTASSAAPASPATVAASPTTTTPAWALAPRPATTPPPVAVEPTRSASTPRPPATTATAATTAAATAQPSAAPAPKPTSTGGYVPSEL